MQEGQKKKFLNDTIICRLWLSTWKTQDRQMKNFSKQVQ